MEKNAKEISKKMNCIASLLLAEAPLNLNTEYSKLLPREYRLITKEEAEKIKDFIGNKATKYVRDCNSGLIDSFMSVLDELAE